MRYSILMRKDADPTSQTVEKQRIKGISGVIARDIRHKDYLAQLHDPVEDYQINRRIGHKVHQLYSFEVCISSFSLFHLTYALSCAFL